MLMTGAGVRAWRRGGDDGEVHGAEKHPPPDLASDSASSLFRVPTCFPTRSSPGSCPPARVRSRPWERPAPSPPSCPGDSASGAASARANDPRRTGPKSDLRFFGCTASMSEVVRAFGEGSDLLGVSFMRCKCVGSLSSFKCFRLGIPEPPVVGQRTTPGTSTDAERRAPQKRQRPNLRSQKRVDREAALRSPFWVNALRTP